MKHLLFLYCLFAGFVACDTPTGSGPIEETAKLRFKFKFNPQQERLNNIGQPATIPAGNAAQTPTFHLMSGHFIELIEDGFTPIKSGEMVYSGAETNAGSATAIDFDQAIVVNEDSIFLEIPISDLNPGTYRHMRVSVSYQNYDIIYNLNNVPFIGNLENQAGTIASFVGYNTYITDLSPKNRNISVNADKLQGFWAFETLLGDPYSSYNDVYTGEAPEGSTTVVNPFAGIVDIPQGSCIVTGSLDTPLTITGNETEDITLTLSFSINQSFEWEDTDGNGKLDLDVTAGTLEPIVDMGLRGLKVLVE